MNLTGLSLKWTGVQTFHWFWPMVNVTINLGMWSVVNSDNIWSYYSTLEIPANINNLQIFVSIYLFIIEFSVQFLGCLVKTIEIREREDQCQHGHFDILSSKGMHRNKLFESDKNIHFNHNPTFSIY